MIRTLPPASMLDPCCGSTMLTTRCAFTERSRSVEVGTELTYRENMIFLCVWFDIAHHESVASIYQIVYGLIILKTALV
jgi:hypothetical protein